MVEVFQYLKLFARTWLKSIDVITLGFTKHTTNTLWMRIFGSSFVFCCDNSFIYSLIPPIISTKVRCIIKYCSQFIPT